MSACIKIRRLQSSDVEEYRSIRLTALKTSPDAFGSTYQVESTRPIEQFKERILSTALFGAFDSEGIVGIMGFRRHEGLKDAHKGNVWGTFVEPRARGKGVGWALGSALLKHASSIEGLEQLLLSVVEENQAAFSLYTRLGFTTYGIEPNALKTANGYSNEVLMVLFLRDI